MCAGYINCLFSHIYRALLYVSFLHISLGLFYMSLYTFFAALHVCLLCGLLVQGYVSKTLQCCTVLQSDAV